MEKTEQERQQAAEDSFTYNDYFEKPDMNKTFQD